MGNNTVGIFNENELVRVWLKIWEVAKTACVIDGVGLHWSGKKYQDA